MKQLSCLPLLAVVIALGLAQPASAGKEDLVGTKIVNDMRIEFYMEAPKHGMVMTSGKPMMMMGTPTHHPEVKIFDQKSGQFIPYMDVALRFRELSSGKEIKIDLPPMLGSWFHYGRNAVLPGKGKYQVTVDVAPHDLMRYKEMAAKWATPVSITFDYQWK